MGVCVCDFDFIQCRPWTITEEGEHEEHIYIDVLLAQFTFQFTILIIINASIL